MKNQHYLQKSPWLFLTRNLETSFKLLSDELSHLTQVIRFFRVNNNETVKQNINSKNSEHISKTVTLNLNNNKLDMSIRQTIGELYYVIEYLNELCENFSLYLKNIREIINDLNKIHLDINDLDIFLYKFKKCKNIIAESASIIDFLQKKLASLLQGYPSYYPTPKETSIRESVKIHRFLELLGSNFLKAIFPSLTNDNSKIYSSTIKNLHDFRCYFYWDFLPNISFLSNPKFLIINSDYILPHRQSFWSILLHEVIHFLTKIFRENFDDSYKTLNEFKELKCIFDIIEYGDYIVNSINNALILTDFLPNDYFDDILIDAIVSATFGASYLLTGFYNLLFYDDYSFFEPKISRLWYFRLIAHIIGAKYHCRLFKPSDAEKDLIKIIEESIKIAYYRQKERSFCVLTDKVFECEKTLNEIIEKLLDKFLREKTINDIINKINRSENCYIKTYNTYLKAYVEKIYEEEFKKEKRFFKEGRPICILFNEIACFGKTNDLQPDNIKTLFDKEVHLFRIYKIRYDSNELKDLIMNENSQSESNVLENRKENSLSESNVLKKIFDEIKKTETNQIDKDTGLNSKETSNPLAFFYSYGSFSFMTYEGVYNEKEYPLKKDKNSNTHNKINIKLNYYKEDLALTLISKSELPNIDEMENSVLCLINFQINRSKNDITFESIKEKFNNLVKILKEDNGKKNEVEISYFLFTSFAWYDFCCLIFIRPNSNSINLDPILYSLKKNFLINNDNLLNRTETHIFIGKNIIDKVIVTFPYVHLRVSSNLLGNSLHNIVEPLRKKDYISEINLRFGIRDIVIKIKNSSNGIKFSEVLEFLYGKDGILRTVDFNLSDIQLVVEVRFRD